MTPRQGMVALSLAAIGVFACRALQRSHARRLRADGQTHPPPAQRVQTFEKLAASERRRELRLARDRLADLAEEAGVEATWSEPSDDDSVPGEATGTGTRRS